MKKKLLFLLGALVLSIGGASAQESLILNYGNNTRWGSGITYGATPSADALSGTWSNGDRNHTTTTTGYGRFEGGNWSSASSGGNGYLGGTAWATTFNEGETHRITLTLLETDSERGNFALRTKLGNTVVQSSEVFSGNATSPIVFDITENYDALEIVHLSYRNQILAIASITREVISDAVGKPTITAPATYDGDETEVTITPGKNTHHVVYSISGSNEDVTDATITEETVLTLTGSNDITITAVGFNEDESESAAAAAVTITYSNVLPSGTTAVWEGNQAFSDNWGQNVAIDKSKFADLEVGDYIFLYATHDGAVPNIGFRNNWSDEVFKTYTETSGGNCAYGNMTAEEEYWWMKVTDETLLNLFKNGTPRIQGQNFTLTKVEIHKAKTVSEAVDNEIAKYENVILNLTRSFNTGGWNTICLPFVPTAEQATEMFGDGYKLAAFTGAEGTTMKFSTITIDNFEAGKPYLVKPTQSEKNEFTFFDVDITVRKATPVTFGDYTFVGVFTKKSFEESEWPTTRFVGAGNKLMTPNSTGALNALRAYFQIADANAAPVLSIDGEDDEATGIRSIENGQLTIDNNYYDLSGRRVVKPTKGVYIMNGKKVILK